MKHIEFEINHESAPSYALNGVDAQKFLQGQVILSV